ncbi:hypothetical protein TIFTF001_020395 [Ficus carica]|uniref:Chalcone-flavonone isomerase family protein n=1 Tax=Ficus carica TaxID=3494 RepID=A0AA88ADM0_FICCA|nr:hypothetical protein TIFTF001_020395 [Ficus carica]
MPACHMAPAAFLLAVTPPGSVMTLFLGGAGKFVKFMAIGVYLELNAVTWLAGKWKGKSAEELNDSVEFYRDIVTAEEKAIEMFLQVFKDKNFPPGSFVLFTQSLSDSLMNNQIYIYR